MYGKQYVAYNAASLDKSIAGINDHKKHESRCHLVTTFDFSDYGAVAFS